MSISITSSAVTLTSTTVTFEDIYQYAVDNNLTTYVQKLNNFYVIKTDLIIKSNSHLEDSKVNIVVEGDLLQVEKGSSLKLGKKRVDGSTYDGCTLSAPNIRLGYGFGHTTTTNSGDLYLYNSVIDIFGFWGFFEGTNRVEIIDCFINGFGRIAGSNSILKNIIFKQSHGKYGILSPKGVLSVMEDMSVHDSLEYYDSYEKVNLRCSVYHNPEFASNLDIYYGRYSGYDYLAYTESYDSNRYNLTFYGSEILDGYELYRETDNVDMYHKFRLIFGLKNSDGSSIGTSNVVIKNALGEVEFSGNTNIDGELDVWLTYYRDLILENKKEIVTPHTIEVTNGDVTSTYTVVMDKNYDYFPLYFGSTSSGGTSEAIDYDRIQAMIDAANCCTDIQNTMSNMSTNIRELLIANSESIAETQTIIESHSDVRIVL